MRQIIAILCFVLVTIFVVRHKMSSELNQIVEEMQATAMANPYNMVADPLAPVICARKLEVDGNTYDVVLTYNIVPHDPDKVSIAAKFWQFSIAADHPIADEVAKKLSLAFLKSDFEEIDFAMFLNEIAKMPPDIQKQLGCQRQYYKVLESSQRVF